MAKHEKTTKGNNPGFFGKMARYFRDTKAELKRVSWPTRKQVINSTVVVIVFAVVIGACVWSLDAVFGFGAKALLGK